LQGGSKKKDGGIIGTVKAIEKTLDIKEQKIKVRFEGGKKEDFI